MGCFVGVFLALLKRFLWTVTVVTVAQTREEAISKMHRALSEYVIEGVKTTIPFHLKLMKDENFIKGNYTTKFLEDFDLTE